jgi:predicted GTPase
MTTRMFQSSSQTLVPSPSQATPSSSFTRHIFSTVSTLVSSHRFIDSCILIFPRFKSLSGPLNVLLFGETGVGKSSVINLIMGENAAQTSPDGATCTLTHTSHKINLGPHTFKLWEVSSIESMGFFETFFKKWSLKKQYKRLYKDDGVYLLLYCMRGSRAQRALLRDYKFFTDIVGSTAGPGRVPVAAVVTSLEDYPKNMDNWWTKNKDNLEHLGMRFSSHACITSLPNDPESSLEMRARRHRSEQVIRRLIYESYQTGAETPRSSSPVLTR